MPAFLGFVPLLQPELGWMLLGENLAAGDSLYEGVWDNIGPLSAAVYWLMDFLFGRSQLAYYLLSSVLIVVQGFIFNYMLLRFKAYNENTYVPSLVYMILANAFYDFFTVTPVLLCLTFLIPALRNLFRIIIGTGSDESILFLGFNTGIAALFYLPSITILIAFLFSLIIFTGTKPRQYLLLILGLLLPLVAVTLYYVWKDQLDSFYWQYYVSSLELLSENNYLNFFSLLLVGILPAVFLVIGIYRYNNAYAFNNYQVRLQQAMFYFLLTGVAAIFLSPEKSAYHFMLVIPTLAFYISHYFLLIRNRLKAELYFLGFFILIPGLNYALLAGSIPYIEEYTNFENMEIRERPEEELTEGKRILSLGNDFSLYKNAKLATPYLDWRLASEELTQLHYYENLLSTFKNLSADPPQVIVDDTGIVPGIFHRMPIIESRYQRSVQYPHVYLLKEKK